MLQQGWISKTLCSVKEAGLKRAHVVKSHHIILSLGKYLEKVDSVGVSGWGWAVGTWSD